MENEPRCMGCNGICESLCLDGFCPNCNKCPRCSGPSDGCLCYDCFDIVKKEESMVKLECLDSGCGETECSGAVEMHSPGYGYRRYPRCERHQAAKLAREDAASRRYPVNAPADFDPSYCGESWNGDD